MTRQSWGFGSSVQPTRVTPRVLPSPDATGIGIVAPFDFALDRELWQWVPDDITPYITRLPYVGKPVSVDLAEALADNAAIAAACRDVSVAVPSVTAYLCTSGSFVGGVQGEAMLRGAMKTGGALRAITTSGALLDALAVLGVKRVGIGTPYDFPLTLGLLDFLEEAGYETVAAACLGLAGDIPRVSPDTVRNLAFAAAHDDAEAIFLSCTNLPTIGVLARLEQDLGRPILSANLVTMWLASRLLGRTAAGRPESLFRVAAAAELPPVSVPGPL